MAEIYKARLEGIGGFQRTFAIKRILPHLSANAEYVNMLVDEAKVAGLLSHANIVQILDLGQVDDMWYIAMEFVEGPDLGKVLRRVHERELPLPLPHALFITIELLKGLEYAHQRQVMRGGRAEALNIIHRDISPPNVLLSFQGEVKLTDFGIAKASHKALQTHAGVIKGRFDYMSPEQAGGNTLDQRSDLFSVGVLLYEMLTGVHPFRTGNELTTIERVRAGEYEAVSAVNPGVPFQLEAIVDRALKVNATDRHPSATAFKDALESFFHDSGFLFNRSTLAAWLQSLFPESSPRRTGMVAQEDPEGPTRVMGNEKVMEEIRKGNNPRLGEEEATIIHKSPLAAPDFPWASPEWAEDPETIVKGSPFPTPSGRLSTRSGSISSGPPPLRNSGVSAGGLPKAPSGGRGLGRLFSLVLTVFFFFFGLAIGGIVVGGALLFLGDLGRPPAGSAAAPLQDPVLRVQGEEGLVIRINDMPVDGERMIPPGEQVQLQVRRGEELVYEAALTLEPGEVRVIVIP